MAEADWAAHADWSHDGLIDRAINVLSQDTKGSNELHRTNSIRAIALIALAAELRATEESTDVQFLAAKMRLMAEAE